MGCKTRFTIYIAYSSFSRAQTKPFCRHPGYVQCSSFVCLLHAWYCASVHTSASFYYFVYRNIYFRSLVEEKRRVYVSAHFKREKRFIAETIVVAIKSLDPPGRFLSRDSKTGVWIPINDDRAREKASQALRENSKTIKAELQQSDDSIRKQVELLPEKRADSSPDYTGSPTSQRQSRQPRHPGSACCDDNRGGQSRATFETQHHPHHYPYLPAPGWAHPHYYGYYVPPFHHPYAFPPPQIPALPAGGPAVCYAYQYVPQPSASAQSTFTSTATLPAAPSACYPAPMEPIVHNQLGVQCFQPMPEQQRPHKLPQQRPLPPDNEPHVVEEEALRQNFVHRSNQQRRDHPERTSPLTAPLYPLSPRSPESLSYENHGRNPRGFLGPNVNTANQDLPNGQQHAETWPPRDANTPLAAFQDMLLQACQGDPSFGSSPMPDPIHHTFTPFATSSPKAPSTVPFNYSCTSVTSDPGESPSVSQHSKGLWWDSAQSSTSSPGIDTTFRQYTP
jgi:hypothetical protein